MKNYKVVYLNSRKVWRPYFISIESNIRMIKVVGIGRTTKIIPADAKMVGL